MRKIKFRAWDDQNKLMIYLDNKDNVLVFDMDGWRMGEADYDWGVIGSQARSETNGHLMQYTGFNDKNGKEIYDGDILRYWFINDKEEDFMKVWFEQGCWCSGIKDLELLSEDLNCNIFEITVAGNIYQNAELISSYEKRS